jgi:IS30 family transposase
LQRIVAGKLNLEWSPEQISGWLKRRYPMKAGMHVSHETIYRSLFVQTRGVLKKELMKHLRSRRVMRHGKGYSTKGKPRGRIIDAISIRERPPEVEDRAVPGHWEGDLISGSGNTHIATLVERQSRFTLLTKIAASGIRVGKLDGLGVHVEPAAVEVDGVTEVLAVAVSAGLALDPLDLAVHAF